MEDFSFSTSISHEEMSAYSHSSSDWEYSLSASTMAAVSRSLMTATPMFAQYLNCMCTRQSTNR